MKFNLKKDNVRSAVFIALSLILMASSLYIGLVRGRIDDEQVAGLDSPSLGLEDLVTQNDGRLSDDVDDEDNNNVVDVISDDADTAGDGDDSSEHIDEETETVNKDVVNISLSYPVSSEKIVMDYSYETEPVFSKTFNEYRSDHTGVDFSAKEGEEVFAAAEGTVSEIYEDERLGITVVISHGAYETKYSNLDRGLFVSVGEPVTVSTALGKVGNTAIYESAEDSHVHFSLYVNGDCVDPKDYLI